MDMKIAILARFTIRRSGTRGCSTKTRRLVRGLSNQYNRAKRIILIRHGESLGNLDDHAYVSTADWKIPLSDRGRQQAEEAGKRLRELIADEPFFVYTSPYLRTRQTLDGILKSFDNETQLLGFREEPRIVEQQFGNYQDLDEVRQAKRARHRFGRFFYRFPNGESGLDVYQRVTSFISTLFRDAQQLRSKRGSIDDVNIVLMTHGLTLRLFLMRWFQYTVEEFEESKNPRNTEIVVMNRVETDSGVQYYELAEESCETMKFPIWGESYQARTGVEGYVAPENP